ncbi:MAG: hypothetical protein ACYCSN_20130, partial [Acidobacteriaceae bacterium]
MWSFAYDGLNRLASAQDSASGGLNQSYSYDSFGNIAQSGAFVFQPSYTSANRVSGFSYDASGN